MECDDQLLHVGREVRITARLGFRDVSRFRFSRRGKVVRFRVDGEDIGQASTNWRGTAAVAFTPKREKEYQVRAACVDEGGRQIVSAEATIFSRSTRREAIIVDIDGTLSVSTVLGSSFRSNKRLPPLEGAVEVTKELARSYDLIAVTGRKRCLRNKTKRWLANNGFPPMPVYFASFLRRPVRHHRFKMKIIGELKRSWKNISIGIGDRDSDARVYRANGLKPIILRQEGPGPPGAVTVRNWRRIREVLLG